MNSPAVRRSHALAEQLGLADRLRATPADRRFARDIEAGLDEVELGLQAQVEFADEIADVTTRYLLDAGGKRIRPTLTLLTAQLGDGATPAVIDAAMAIEITHLASLYHDDVMDDSERRRGVPSAQTVWGNSVAILAGDLLFARASQLMAGLGEGAIRLQAATFERLVLGQLHETTGPKPGEDPVAHYIQVLADKTGSLIATAAQAGVIFSGAPSAYEQPIVGYGERIGVAFQLADDVIDMSPQPEKTGKVPGTDLRAGVVTLPLLKLRQATDADSQRLLAALDERVIGAASVAPDADALIAELRAHDVTAQTLAEAHRWAREAVACLDPLPDGQVKTALTRFAESVVDRTS